MQQMATQQANNQPAQQQQQTNPTVTYTAMPGRLKPYQLIDYSNSAGAMLYQVAFTPLNIKFNVSSSGVIVFSNQLQERAYNMG